MLCDTVVERGEVAASSKSWNAERGVVATWSCGNAAEGAAEADVWRGRKKSGVRGGE